MQKVPRVGAMSACSECPCAAKLGAFAVRLAQLEHNVTKLNRQAGSFSAWTNDHVTDHYNYDRKSRAEWAELASQFKSVVEAMGGPVESWTEPDISASVSASSSMPLIPHATSSTQPTPTLSEHLPINRQRSV